MRIKPDMDTGKRLFAALENHWKEQDGAKGIYRPCYDRLEEEAIDAFAAEAKVLGLKTFRDFAGNAYFLMEGSDPTRPVILSGSHVDSVPFGGQYDGTAGVVAALSAISGIKLAGLTPEQGICVMICRGEESAWFGQVSIGSKAATGTLPEQALNFTNSHSNNITLRQAMQNLAMAPDKLRKGTPLIPLSHIACFIELHIEQGPVLQSIGAPIGIVSGIRGNIRYRSIKYLGEAGHTGTVPHDMRRDAVRAICRLIAELEDRFLAIREEGGDIVFTFPIINTLPTASLTTIPEYAECAIEVRSESNEVLDRAEQYIEAALADIAKRYNVECRIDLPMTRSAPALMDKTVQEALNTLAGKTPILPSGAGHDAAVFANAGIPCGMIFIRHDGISHRHDETMPWDDFEQGTTLLTEFFRNGFPGKPAEPDFRTALINLGAIEI